MAISTREFPMDAEVMRLLSSDTRIRILRLLSERRMTVSELARLMELNKSTLHEHLRKMVGGGLIVKHETPERQWVYYALTTRAHDFVKPSYARPYQLPFFWGLVSAIVVAALLAALIPGLAPAPSPLTGQLSDDTVLAGSWKQHDLALSAPVERPVVEIREKLEAPGPSGRLVSVPDVGLVAPDRLAWAGALETGDYVVMVSDAATGRALAEAVPLHAEPAQVATEPSYLLAGVDRNVPVRIQVSTLRSPLAGGIVATSAIAPAHIAALEFSTSPDSEGRAQLVLTPKEPGVVSFTYRPEGEGSVFASASGALAVELPDVRVIPQRLLVGQENEVKITASHPQRGPLPGLAVTVTDAAGTLLAAGVTDSEGHESVFLTPSGPGEMQVRAGGVPPVSIVAGEAGVVYTRVSSYAVTSVVPAVEETRTFGAFLRNTRAAVARELVLFKVDGVERGRHELPLAAGEGALVEFQHRFDDGRAHELTITGIAPFAARGPASASEAYAVSELPPPGPGLAAALEAGTVLAATVALLALRKRGRVWP